MIILMDQPLANDHQNVMESKVKCPHSISRTCLAKEFGLVSWEFICLYILVEQHVLWPLDGVSETAAAIANMHAIPNKGHS